jgi:hypothetical protein
MFGCVSELVAGGDGGDVLWEGHFFFRICFSKVIFLGLVDVFLVGRVMGIGFGEVAISKHSIFHDNHSAK